jgi:hypothetical protein
MSSASCARMCGRWTFTTTSRPSRSVATCAWPRLAEASGSCSKESNSLLMRPPSSSWIVLSISAKGTAPTSS